MLNMKGELLLDSRRTIGKDRETVISCPATALDTITVWKIGREGGRGHSLEADRQIPGSNEISAREKLSGVSCSYIMSVIHILLYYSLLP